MLNDDAAVKRTTESSERATCLTGISVKGKIGSFSTAYDTIFPVVERSRSRTWLSIGSSSGSIHGILKLSEVLIDANPIVIEGDISIITYCHALVG